MTGKRTKQRQGHWRANDWTVYDFANSCKPATCCRIKKSANSTVKKEKDVMSWFDYDLDDFEESLRENSSELIGEHDDYVDKVSHPAGRHSNKGMKISKNAGVVYPLDVWFLLSLHIEPENIGIFALLCRDSYHTTQSCLFWKNLYRRHFVKKRQLPEDLGFHILERHHGLRARCIRSLYILSSVLSARVQRNGRCMANPQMLIGHRCLLLWYQPVCNRWHFCFKMKRQLPCQTEGNKILCSNLQNGRNNLFYNQEDGCCVLRVVSTHFLGATSPHIMGMALTGARISLSDGLQHHRVRLTFDNTVCIKKTVNHDIECILDPVISIEILNWWDPAYQFPT